jgi:hypothetical protein
MTILLTALLVVVGLIIADPTPSAAQGSERHSGVVVSVDPATRTLALQELVEGGRPRRLDVRIPDGATVVMSERVPDEHVARLEAAFVERPIDLRDVRPGDFVVVEGAARGNMATAHTVVVTFREGAAEAPAASPGERARP